MMRTERSSHLSWGYAQRIEAALQGLILKHSSKLPCVYEHRMEDPLGKRNLRNTSEHNLVQSIVSLQLTKSEHCLLFQN